MKYHRILVVVVLVAICAAITIVYIHHVSAIVIDQEKLYKITRVIDGDTFKAQVGSHEITVRLLGINTPETVDPRRPVECYGTEASAEAKLLLTGHTVQLKLNPNREEQDKYKRYLVYAYREDGMFINEHLIESGFAKEYTYGKAYSLRSQFKAIEKQAKEEKKGLWGVCEQSMPIKPSVN